MQLFVTRNHLKTINCTYFRSIFIVLPLVRLVIKLRDVVYLTARLVLVFPIGIVSRFNLQLVICNGFVYSTTIFVQVKIRCEKYNNFLYKKVKRCTRIEAVSN